MVLKRVCMCVWMVCGYVHIFVGVVRTRPGGRTATSTGPHGNRRRYHHRCWWASYWLVWGRVGCAWSVSRGSIYQLTCRGPLRPPFTFTSNERSTHTRTHTGLRSCPSSSKQQHQGLRPLCRAGRTWGPTGGGVRGTGACICGRAGVCVRGWRGVRGWIDDDEMCERVVVGVRGRG